jgi:hypothetical protein
LQRSASPARFRVDHHQAGGQWFSGVIDCEVAWARGARAAERLTISGRVMIRLGLHEADPAAVEDEWLDYVTYEFGAGPGQHRSASAAGRCFAGGRRSRRLVAEIPTWIGDLGRDGRCR